MSQDQDNHPAPSFNDPRNVTVGKARVIWADKTVNLDAHTASGKVTKDRLALTADRLRSLLAYDEATGIFIRRKDGPGVKAGDRAGWVGKHGHIYMDLDGCRYAAHRLAWLYVYGIWPTQDIDHINGDSGFNAISNLRDVSKFTNMQNQRRAKTTSKTGILGVTWDVARSKFYASIEVDGKKKSLGRHTTIEAAAEAYLKAKRALHEGCTI